jgi:hypothetical protein
MVVELDEIQRLLKSDSLTRIETEISVKRGSSIYKDDLPILIGFIKKEIESSEFSINSIAKFINDNEKTIADFGLLLLESYVKQMLSLGIAITYAIYLMYLQEKNNALLEQYLIKRRIPDPIKFLNKLNAIASKMNII